MLEIRYKLWYFKRLERQHADAGIHGLLSVLFIIVLIIVTTDIIIIIIIIIIITIDIIFVIE